MRRRFRRRRFFLGEIMGGGRTNGAQADAANTAANKQAQASAALSDENLGEQKQNFNYLFGSNGKGGSLTPMMDPNSLNVTTPTGAYKAQLTNTQNTLNDSYNKQKGSLAQTWANRGFAAGMPNGFQADQERQLGRDQADSNGTAFATAVGQQYQDALSNFWNANNLASGQAASARSGALEGSANAGSVDTSLYGTASQYHASPAAAIVGSALGAGGQLGAAALTGGGSTAAGAAACPAAGSRLRTDQGDRNVEDLREGDMILQRTGNYEPLTADPLPLSGIGVRIITRRGRASKVSESHAWCVPSGGYIEAEESKLALVSAEDEPDTIESVYRTGADYFYLLSIRGDRTYLCDGLWSLV
jgi:hypothetical protein